MFGYIFLTFVIFIIIFIVCRQFMCWYFKINNIVSLLEEQNTLIKKYLNINATPPTISLNKTISHETSLKNKTFLKRIKCIYGSSVAVDIFIDDKPSMQLANDEEKVIDIENGIHKIIAKYYDDSYEFEFDINNDSKYINILVDPKLKIEFA